LLVFAAIPGFAHFQCLIPSNEIIMTGDERDISLELMFMHPFEGDYMEMAEPVSFGVKAAGKTVGLNGRLRMHTQGGF
jgi:cobalt/nickel transport protein